MSSGGMERYERLLALHHALQLNRRITASHLLHTESADRTEYPLSLHQQDQRLLAESLQLITGAGPELARRFYEKLFTGRPFLRGLFPEYAEAMIAQHDKLLRALLALVAGYAEPSRLLPVLTQLGRDHRKFGVRPAHYPAVGEALVATLRELAGPHWRWDHEQAWNRAYTLAADVMVAAAAESEGEPPWWYATVVGHELRHPDIAVVRVRPHEPYPYRSGQFATVEPPNLPRMWRPYSMATAPALDGVLEFHVRAVSGGAVSSALVHKTTVGDELRIGPPMGTSVLDQDSRRDLLLLSGGTGLAPCKALVDELARGSRRDRRWVRWFVGARQSGDLYDVGSLRQLAAVHPWLSIMFVVSDDASYPGERGLVSDVFGRYGDWRDHDVYLAGPPGMVGASLHRLTRLGVQRERIRWDAYGELAEVA